MNLDGRRTVATSVRTAMQPVLPSKSDGSQSLFGNVVVDLDPAIFGIADERGPALEHVADSFGGIRFRRELTQGLVQPTVHGVKQRTGSPLARGAPHIWRFAAYLAFEF